MVGDVVYHGYVQCIWCGKKTPAVERKNAHVCGRQIVEKVPMP